MGLGFRGLGSRDFFAPPRDIPGLCFAPHVKPRNIYIVYPKHARSNPGSENLRK